MDNAFNANGNDYYTKNDGKHLIEHIRHKAVQLSNSKQTFKDVMDIDIEKEAVYVMVFHLADLPAWSQ